MDINYKLIFEHNGKTLESGTSIKIISQDGLSASEYGIYTADGAGMDGAVVTGLRTLPRQIEFTGDYRAADRQKLLSFFNPKFPGKLTVQYNGATRFINYYVRSANFRSTNIHNESEPFTLRLLCVKPYFLGMDDYGQNIAARSNMFAFPFTFTEKTGIIADYQVYDSQVPVENSGDLESGILVSITANATVENPKFVNVTTGEEVDTNILMHGGDVLAINTNEGEIGLTLNGENVSHCYNRQTSSPDMKLGVGLNLVRYSAKAGVADMEVRLQYRPKFIGV